MLGYALVINIYVQKKTKGKENSRKRLNQNRLSLFSDEKFVLERRERDREKTKVLNKEKKKEEKEKKHPRHFHANLICCLRHKTRMIYTTIYGYIGRNNVKTS